MNALKDKKNTIAEDRKIESERGELPPRIRKLISAAVRVWELKRGIRATCPTHHINVRRNQQAVTGIF